MTFNKRYDLNIRKKEIAKRFSELQTTIIEKSKEVQTNLKIEETKLKQKAKARGYDPSSGFIPNTDEVTKEYID